ncbi:MAG: ExbD/TolR family protein [Phycisphaeraceae bacterium]
MYRVRRHDLSPRVELLPMIDVIFLLLTFFIYSMVVLVRPQLLPVQLVPVGEGESAEPGQVQAITLDGQGRLHLNREPVTAAALDERLRAWARQESPPRLFLAVEQNPGASAATIDRAPMLIRLIERVRSAGIEDFAVVGPPPDGAPVER